jgi:hypothetical protein
VTMSEMTLWFHHLFLSMLDENECRDSNVCGNGTCFNVEGGFECSCTDGFAPGPNQICEDVSEVWSGKVLEDAIEESIMRFTL